MLSAARFLRRPLLPKHLFNVSHFALNLPAHFFDGALIPQIGIANDLPRHLLDLAFGFVNCAFDFVGFAGFHTISSQPAVEVVVPVFTNKFSHTPANNLTQQRSRKEAVYLVGNNEQPQELNVTIPK